ncbi:hypothetical protein [uncultured Paraglaciecola sp.]|uniref:portal protein n=1 Tax=uncultured Paraglaciecola sp. TaxID=1765024 RepID=UPI002602968F|nr:hypothetical protein [uncultured Paraglaciecola sp.]
MAGLSLLRVVSNSDLASKEQEERDKEIQERQSSELILGMSAYLRTAWSAAKIAKKPIEDIMLTALRQRNGEYEPDKMAAIKKQGGSEVYMMITEVKCRAAESWLRDILLDNGTPPWDIQPTPIPDLKDHDERILEEGVQEKIVQSIGQGGAAMNEQEITELREIVAQDYRFALLQEAQDRATKMKHKISDQFAQGGWPEAFNDFVSDIVTFPAAFLKGPVVRRQRTLGWEDVDGKTVAKPIERIAPEYERVDPFNIYPEPGITNIQDGYMFELHPLTRTMLSDLIGVPGYDDQAIRKVLELGVGESWIKSDVTLTKDDEERKFHTEMRPTDMYDALEFWGKISGSMLREWGMSEKEIPDPALEYDANVWMVGNYVIKAVLNFDPLGEKPYAKTSFIKRPGAFWGSGIPEIIEDVQSICNASARALINNMGIASGPQVEVNVDRLPPNENITQVFPWKIWQVTTDPSGTSNQAVRFNQPEDNSSKLMAVYEKFSKLADDHSGIPSYLYGDLNVQGAGRTSSGLSMLMGSAGKGIRQVVMHIDSDVIKPVVQRQFVYNMRYDPDESIKGDAEIVARGAVNLAVKETMNVRRLEFLQATSNDLDLELMGPNGRAAILREIAKSLELDHEEVIPSREKRDLLQRSQAALPPVGAQQQPGAPVPTHPDGSPKGGQAGNTVSNQFTGGAS